MTIRRTPETGLAKSGHKTDFTKKVRDRATGARNPMGGKKQFATLSDQQRAAKVVKYVNVPLASSHVPKVTGQVDPGMTFPDAEFDFQTWTVKVGAGDPNNPPTDADAAEVANSVYHESRHAEQWFRIARKRAGDDKTLTADQLAAAMFIPKHIAEAAIKRPLKKQTKVSKALHSKKHNRRQAKKLTEADSWDQSVYGTGAQHRNAVLGDTTNRYDEYRALPEEVDAWAVGDDVGATSTAKIAKTRAAQHKAAQKKAKKSSG